MLVGRFRTARLSSSKGAKIKTCTKRWRELGSDRLGRCGNCRRGGLCLSRSGGERCDRQNGQQCKKKNLSPCRMRPRLRAHFVSCDKLLARRFNFASHLPARIADTGAAVPIGRSAAHRNLSRYERQTEG